MHAVVLYCQSCISNISFFVDYLPFKNFYQNKMFHWKSFVVTYSSAKTEKLFNHKWFALYGISKGCQCCTGCLNVVNFDPFDRTLTTALVTCPSVPLINFSTLSNFQNFLRHLSSRINTTCPWCSSPFTMVPLLYRWHSLSKIHFSICSKNDP